ncbi:MAG: carboxypeptidase-like regulatory domain-containing protein [Thermoplasmata archaeon]|nr:carboxypeptidase-like regulatory domain-containing protein [Thermoplasmata archaeon]
MFAEPVPLRCTACGRLLVATSPVAVSATWVACPSCGRPVAVVHPRDPPPLFSWEVYPHLYPALPPVPRASGSLRTLSLVVLVAASVLLAGVAIALVLEGAFAFGPGPYAVRGSIETGGLPNGPFYIPGATIVVHDERGLVGTTMSDAAGAFRIGGLAPGRVTLDVSARGYAPAHAITFVSSVYASSGTDADPLGITLTYGSPSSNVTQESALAGASFSNLEEFIANLLSSAVLLAIGLTIALAGVLTIARNSRPAVGAAGAAAAAGAPVALFVLGIATPFPLLAGLGGLGMLLGLTALIAQGVRMARSVERED